LNRIFNYFSGEKCLTERSQGDYAQRGFFFLGISGKASKPRYT